MSMERIQVLVDAEEVEKLGQIGRVPFATQIGLGNADVAATDQAGCENPKS